MAVDLLDVCQKVSLRELHSGELTPRGENMVVLVTDTGEYSHVRVLGTIVDHFVSPQKNFASITLDDGTDTVRAKAFRERVSHLESLKQGDLVDVTGRVKDYEDERYIALDTVWKTPNPNWELLRAFELLAAKKGVIAAPESAAAPVEESLAPLILDKIHETDKGDGVKIQELIKDLKDKNEEAVLDSLRTLMMRGDVYEPKKGVVKLV